MDKIQLCLVSDGVTAFIWPPLVVGAKESYLVGDHKVEIVAISKCATDQIIRSAGMPNKEFWNWQRTSKLCADCGYDKDCMRCEIVWEAALQCSGAVANGPPTAAATPCGDCGECSEQSYRYSSKCKLGRNNE